MYSFPRDDRPTFDKDLFDEVIRDSLADVPYKHRSGGLSWDGLHHARVVVVVVVVMGPVVVLKSNNWLDADRDAHMNRHWECRWGSDYDVGLESHGSVVHQKINGAKGSTRCSLRFRAHQTLITISGI